MQSIVDEGVIKIVEKQVRKLYSNRKIQSRNG